MIRAARLKCRVGFYTENQSQDDSGAIQLEDAHVFTCWGELLPSKRIPSETETQGRELTVNFFDLTIRYRPAFSANLVVKCSGITYRIVSIPVDPDGLKESLTMRLRQVG